MRSKERRTIWDRGAYYLGHFYQKWCFTFHFLPNSRGNNFEVGPGSFIPSFPFPFGTRHGNSTFYSPFLPLFFFPSIFHWTKHSVKASPTISATTMLCGLSYGPFLWVLNLSGTLFSTQFVLNLTRMWWLTRSISGALITNSCNLFCLTSLLFLIDGWRVSIRHVLYEANHCDDHLTNERHKGSLTIFERTTPP